MTLEKITFRERGESIYLYRLVIFYIVVDSIVLPWNVEVLMFYVSNFVKKNYERSIYIILI